VIRVQKVAFPSESRLHQELALATFHDAFEANLADPSLSALEIAIRYMRATPDWVEALLHVRNRMVAPLGLRDSGAMGALGDRPASAYAVGDSLGLFTIQAIAPDELVLSADDKHADVRVAFLKRRHGECCAYVIASWVRTRNVLGRLYMLPVGRIHPLVVKAGMQALVI